MHELGYDAYQGALALEEEFARARAARRCSAPRRRARRVGRLRPDCRCRRCARTRCSVAADRCRPCRSERVGGRQRGGEGGVCMGARREQLELAAAAVRAGDLDHDGPVLLCGDDADGRTGQRPTDLSSRKRITPAQDAAKRNGRRP